jgi:hypothetical protein
MALNLQYPLGTYTVSNPPSNETLKTDLNNVQDAVNQNETDIAGKLGITEKAASATIADTATTATTATTANALAASATIVTPTLTKPVVNASTQGVQTYSPAGAGTATLDLSLANRNKITMPAGNITIAVSNAAVGQIFTVDITQDGGGSRTVTWFTTIRGAGGTAPTLTTTGSKRDSFIFVCTGSNLYDGYVIGFNI